MGSINNLLVAKALKVCFFNIFLGEGPQTPSGLGPPIPCRSVWGGGQNWTVLSGPLEKSTMDTKVIHFGSTFRTSQIYAPNMPGGDKQLAILFLWMAFARQFWVMWVIRLQTEDLFLLYHTNTRWHNHVFVMLTNCPIWGIPGDVMYPRWACMNDHCIIPWQLVT